MREQQLQPSGPFNFTVTREGEPKIWNKPDGEQVKVWMLKDLMGGALFYIIAPVLMAVFSLAGRDFECFGISLIVLAIPSIALNWWAAKRFENYEFAFTDTMIYIRMGVYNKKSTTIDYTRIQNVDYTQGVIERRYGLYTLKIETAGGGGAQAEGVLEGVRDPRTVSEFIMARATAARSGMPGMEAAPAGTAATVPYPPGTTAGDASQTGPRKEEADMTGDISGEVMEELRETNRLLREIAEKLGKDPDGESP